jgi:hypothetical protein
MFDLTPKKLIIDAIKSKLEGTGVTKLVLVFNVHTDTYTVMVQNTKNESIKMNIEKDDMNLIKKVLITKLQKAITKKKNIESYKAIIIEVELTEETFLTFIQHDNDDITKFDF